MTFSILCATAAPAKLLRSDLGEVKSRVALVFRPDPALRAIKHTPLYKPDKRMRNEGCNRILVPHPGSVGGKEGADGPVTPHMFSLWYRDPRRNHIASGNGWTSVVPYFEVEGHFDVAHVLHPIMSAVRTFTRIKVADLVSDVIHVAVMREVIKQFIQPIASLDWLDAAPPNTEIATPSRFDFEAKFPVLICHCLGAGIEPI